MYVRGACMQVCDQSLADEVRRSCKKDWLRQNGPAIGAYNEFMRISYGGSNAEIR